VADWGFFAVPGSPRGTGRRLGKAALEYGFGTLGLHKICGQVLSFNDASLRMHQALGFREEGCLREQSPIDDTHHDLVCFGLLAREWRD
jgi:RimJ/RimL family protein N-acetyltransferase